MQQQDSHKVDLTGYFYAINENSDIDIPAVFLDDTTGTEAILIFSSIETAKKYCYVTRPAASPAIYQLDRKTMEIEGESTVVQTGLIRIARNVKKHRMSQITHFVLDHPGTVGRASYIEVDSISSYGRRPIPSGITTVDDLSSFLEKEMED